MQHCTCGTRLYVKTRNYNSTEMSITGRRRSSTQAGGPYNYAGPVSATPTAHAQPTPPPVATFQPGPGPFVQPAQATPQQIYTPSSYDYGAPPPPTFAPDASTGFGPAVPASAAAQPNIMVPATPTAAAAPPPPPAAANASADVPVSNGPGE